MKTFGQVIAAARKAAGLTQRAVALRLRRADGRNVLPPYLNDLEHYHRYPPENEVIEPTHERSGHGGKQISLNRATIIGHLGQDPELRYLPASGQPVTGFSVATTKPSPARTATVRSGFNGTTLSLSENSLKPVRSISAKDSRYMLKAGCARENSRAKTVEASASARK